MIVLWSILTLLWIFLALHYFTSYREWRKQDKLRRAEREEWRAKSGL